MLGLKLGVEKDDLEGFELFGSAEKFFLENVFNFLCWRI